MQNQMQVLDMNSRHYIRHSALLTVCAAALCVALAPGDARAQSFKDALGMAYTTNPTIDAARAELRGVDELVPQARGGYLPTITGNAYGGLSHQEQDPGASDSLNPYGASITAQQPLYRGGKTVASINQAKETVQSQRGVLFDTEQQVLLSAATAFFNVVRDQAVVDLTRNNENVLSKQLEASQDRFRVGEVTRTDVSQSESRHSRAISDRIAAEGNLEVSRSNFARIVGQMPEKLEQPDLSVELPGTLDEAVAIALDNNPTVRAARAGEKAAITVLIPNSLICCRA
jgi:TolC family type I secretion outer membrane protein